MRLIVMVVVLVVSFRSYADPVDQVDDSGWTALQRAAQAGDTATIEALVKRGANLEASSAGVYRGATALVIALEFGTGPAARLLLQAGARTDGKLGQDALTLAARGGFDDVVDTLLARHVPIAGTRALYLAAHYEQRGAVRRLLAAGAKVDEPDHDDHDFTALIYACQGNAPGAAKLLLAAGANPNVRDGDGMPVLHWAVYAARPTEMHVYAGAGKPHGTRYIPATDAPLVDLLLAKGAKLDATDREGNTALHHAVLMNARPAAVALLAAGAKRELRSKTGKTALDLAKERANSFEELLRPARASR